MFAKLTSRGYDLPAYTWFPAKKSPVKSPLLFACWVIFHDFYCLLQHFQKKNYYAIMIKNVKIIVWIQIRLNFFWA